LAKYFLKLGDTEVEAEVHETPDGLRVNLGDGWRLVHLQRLGASPRYALTMPDRTLDVLALETETGIEVVIGGTSYSVSTTRPRKGRGGREEEEDGHFANGVWTLRSPITGSVVDIRVAVGDTVEQGAILMVVEAMKMQNELRSRVSGTVASVKVEKGQRVETGAPLIEVSAPPE
jgi:biotin carboxyl carrier protein